MKNAFWNFLARYIGTRPNVADAIINIGKRTEYMHLYHYDGSDYMGRWWLMPRFLLTKDENGNPYPYRWLPIIIRLHHIRSPDWDRDLHDHPSTYRTILLRGAYVERDINGVSWLRQQGETVLAPASKFHNIEQISEGGVWTIFIMRKKTNNWGFLVDGNKVPWREYEGRN